MPFSADAFFKCNYKDTATLLEDDTSLALDELVTIVPRVDMDTLHCVERDYGPFRNGVAASVPLWLAQKMARQRRCILEIPSWMAEEELKKLRDDERENKDQFMPINPYYIELMLIFLEKSKIFADAPGRKKRTVEYLREILEARRRKIATGLKENYFMGEDATVQLDVTNLSASELTCYRLRSCHGLDTFVDLLKAKAGMAKEDDMLGELEATPATVHDSFVGSEETPDTGSARA